LPDWFTPRRFAVFLLLAFVLAFPGIWLGTETFFRSDYGVMAYPSAHYLRESLRVGELPLWNPLSNCGAPFLAQWGTMCLYPGSLFFVALPMPWALGVFCLLHLWLGGLGARALAERWTGNRFAAAVAGTAFAINGASLACITWPNYCVALGWMPWIVLLTEQAWREGGRKLVLAALAGTMQMLTGVPELVVLTWGLLAVMLVAEWVQSSKFKVQSQSAHEPSVPLAPIGGEGRGEGVGHPQPTAPKSPAPSPLITYHFSLLTRFTAVILLITALSAAQLLPFFDLLAHSQRDAAYRDARWPMPPWGWANFLVPLFRYFQTPQGLWVQQDQQFLSSYYLGLGVLALALLAVWKSRERRVWLLAGATAFALVMALGDAGYLYTALKHALPGGGIARFPVKFVLLAAFTAPMLAAFGVAWLMGNAEGGRRKAEPAATPRPVGRDSVEPSIPPQAVRAQRASPAAASETETRCARLAALEMGFDGVSPYRALLTIGIALVAAVAAVLWLGQQHPLQYDRWPETTNNALIRISLLLLFLVTMGALLRPAISANLVASLVLLVLLVDLLGHMPAQSPRVPAFTMSVWPKLSQAPEVTGVEPRRFFITPFAEQDLLYGKQVNWPAMHDDTGHYAGFQLDVWPDHLLMDALSKGTAKWSHLNLLSRAYKVNGSSTLQVREQADVQKRLYPTNLATVPNADGMKDFLAVNRIINPRGPYLWTKSDSALALVAGGTAPTFSESAELLDQLVAPRFAPRRVVYLPLEAQGFVPTNSANARVTTHRFAAHEILAEVETDAPTLVTVAQSFYHPWRAFVDGQPVKLWRANYAFQALVVPAGKHTIRLVYVDEQFRLGVGISLAGLAVCGFLWWRAGRATTSAPEPIVT
jgi:hypothetical protein